MLYVAVAVGGPIAGVAKDTMTEAGKYAAKVIIEDMVDNAIKKPKMMA